MGTMTSIDHSSARAALTAEVRLEGIERELSNLARCLEVFATRELPAPIHNVSAPSVSFTAPAPTSPSVEVKVEPTPVQVGGPNVTVSAGDPRRPLWCLVGLAAIHTCGYLYELLRSL